MVDGAPFEHEVEASRANARKPRDLVANSAIIGEIEFAAPAVVHEPEGDCSAIGLGEDGAGVSQPNVAVARGHEFRRLAQCLACARLGLGAVYQELHAVHRGERAHERGYVAAGRSEVAVPFLGIGRPGGPDRPLRRPFRWNKDIGIGQGSPHDAQIYSVFKKRKGRFRDQGGEGRARSGERVIFAPAPLRLPSVPPIFLATSAAMIFRQLFDSTSSTYTYLMASRHGGEALIIDPVLERVDRYVQLLRELDLRLVKAIDTHLHADHITGLEALSERTRCMTVMGEQSKAEVVSMRVSDGDRVEIEGLSLEAVYTPGHTDDSYSFIMPDRVFTGDTLLIRGTGRTDFQNGDPRAQYESLFGRLLKLPDETLVYPAHDYKGDTVSTIGEEKAFNPRLQVKSADEYVALMNSLNLSNPKMMDVAVPANMRQG